MEGDHIDRDRLNYRRSNLRALPKGKNSQNQSSYRGSSSAYRGVSWDRRRGKWSAYVCGGGKTTSLGRFNTEEAAAAAAKDGRARLLPFAVD
jgi:hypothetical protein